MEITRQGRSAGERPTTRYANALLHNNYKYRWLAIKIMLPALWGDLEELERWDNLLFVPTANWVSAAPYPDEYDNDYCKHGKASHRDALECKPYPRTPMYLFEVGTKRILLACTSHTGVRNSSPHLDEILCVPQITFAFAWYRCLFLGGAQVKQLYCSNNIIWNVEFRIKHEARAYLNLHSTSLLSMSS